LLPRPTSIGTSGASSNFATGAYSYDGAGNIMAMGPDAFSYDSRSRLVSATLGGAGSQSYSYDRYGNLLAKGGNTFCSGSCANNQVSGASYVRGNLTVFGGQTFSYDGLDRMVTNNSSGLFWNYLYDGSDERIGKIPPSGSPTFTIRDEGKRVSSEYSATTIARDNVFLGSQLVLAYANAAISANGPVWTYYASDHLGTPRLVTDASGPAVESRRYWPYGEAVPTQSPFESLRFASMEFDAEGGTAGGLASDRYYDHARSHVGGLGRFLSPDRVGGRSENPQTWNRYAYALNGPIRLLDANGRQPTAFQEASTKIAPIADAIATTAEGFAAVPFQGEAMSQAAGLVGLAAQTLNLGTATGEAIGMGADAFTLTNAIASDVLTASLFTFV